MTTIINLNFETNDDAKKALRQLKYDIDSENFKFFHGVPMLTVDESFETENGVFLELDNICKNRKSICIEVDVYIPKVFQPCVDSFRGLGHTSFNILECFDHEDATSRYYINNREVSYLEYYSHLYGCKKEKINSFGKHLMTGQRVQVKAELKKYQTVNHGDLCMQFSSKYGESFSYEGMKLHKLTLGHFESQCTFFSNFVIVKKGQKFLLNAVCPTKVVLKKKELSSVPKFRGENKKFYNAIAGKWIDSYILNYQTEIEEALLSMTKQSVCGVLFEEIYEFIELTRESPDFDGFGICIHAIERESDFYKKPRRYVEIVNNEVPASLINLDKVYKHLYKNIEGLEVRTKSGFNCLVWSVGEVKIGLLIIENGFNLTVTDKLSSIEYITPGGGAEVIPSS